MALKYQTGEEIQQGDHVLFHRERATVDLVVQPDSKDAAHNWYVSEFGGGVLIAEAVGHPTFIHADSIPDYEDLEFVSRAEASPEGTK